MEDYKEILHYANDRHIEVIPEIDMPGHSHAAVRAMKVRYVRLMAKVRSIVFLFILSTLPLIHFLPSWSFSLLPLNLADISALNQGKSFLSP